MTTSKTTKTVKCDHCKAVIKKDGINLSSRNIFNGIKITVGKESDMIGPELDFCGENCLTAFFLDKIKELKDR